MKVLVTLLGAACGGALISCGSVSGSDPSFWQPSHDVGAPDYNFTPGTSNNPPPPENGGEGAGGFTSAGGSTPGGFTGGEGGFNNGAGGDLGNGGNGNPQPTTTGTTPPPPPPPGTNSGKCTFSFSVTTVTAHGSYAPRNVGAIWIDDASGKFVKTLQEWGQQRIGNATAWETASNGNTVDAVTGATLPNHGTHTVNWDCTDLSNNAVPDDTYSVNVTFAESDAFPFFGPAPIQAAVSFTKGSAAFDKTAPDVANFTGMHLTYHSP